MRWATRPGIHVDRAASAWLITKFVDADATFEYITDLDDVEEAATPFDYVGCELSHHGNDVTFETILRTYDLADPILWKIGEMVHEADVEDGRFDVPEAPGFDMIVRALSSHRPDEEVRALAGQMLDSIEHQLRAGRTP